MSSMLPWTPLLDLLETACIELVHQKPGVQLPWYPTLTKYLNGLRPKEVTLLCAATGAGKTELLAGMAAQLLEQQVPVMVAPVETGDVDFVSRMLGHIAEQPLNRSEAIPPKLMEEIMKKHGPLFANSNCAITNYDDRVPIKKMLETIEFFAEQRNTKVFLLDNLNFFLDVSSTDMERAIMDEAVHSLVMAAKRLSVHILLIVHPKKTDGGKVLSEFDIKGSSTAVQECANVLLFNRPDEKQVEKGELTWADRELIFKKIRKRGMYVNRKFHMTFLNGRYREITPKESAHGADNKPAYRPYAPNRSV